MNEASKREIKTGFNRFGFELRPAASLPEASANDWQLVNAVKSSMMTSTECLWSTLIAVRLVARNQMRVPSSSAGFGAVVKRRSPQARFAANVSCAIWLFDTFAGMTLPTAIDVNVLGESSMDTYLAHQKGEVNTWALATLEEVLETMQRTGYPSELLHFVKGPVETTLRNDALPDLIAVLRLDTGRYESTRDALEILFPKLSSGGVLVVDDYAIAGARGERSMNILRD